MPSRVRIVRRSGGRKRYVRRGAGAIMGRRRPITRGGLAKYIRRVVKGQSETKYVSNAYDTNSTQLLPNWYAPPNLANAASYHPALPALTQGAGDFQRIGAKIMPVKCYTDLTVGYTGYDLSCNEVIVTIYYGTTKAGKTWQAGSPIQSAGDLLDNGDGTTGPFTGLKGDLLYPINKHMNNARRITFKLGKTAGLLNDNGVATAGMLNGAYATSNGGSFKTVRLNFRPPHALQYNGAGYLWPDNYAPWFAISFCRVDDVPTTALSDKTRISVSSLNHMYFKDV